jgi:septal ring factor EnvC (AmiA/AmiB activator)
MEPTEQKIAQLEANIAALQTKIDGVEGKISHVEAQLSQCDPSDVETLRYWRTKESQLQTKENQLRTEKEILLKLLINPIQMQEPFGDALTTGMKS